VKTACTVAGALEFPHPGAELDGQAELLATHARQRLREDPRVAARVGEVAHGARDLVLHGLEHRIEPGDRRGVEHLLLLAMLGQERHLLDARLQLAGIAVEVEGAAGHGLVGDALAAHDLVQHRPAVLAEAELDQRVAPRARPCTRAGTEAPRRRAAGRA